MDPREVLAHYLKLHRESTGQTFAELGEYLGINKGWLCAAEHPSKYTGRRSAVTAALSNLLEELELTFAPVDSDTPTAAHIMMLIGLMDIRPDAKAMAIHAVHRAAMMTEKESTCESES